MSAKSLFFICFLLVLYGTAVSLTRKYFYVSQMMPWTLAQNCCRENNGDLATITTEEENQSAMKTTGSKSVWTWIGLNRTAPDVNDWQWSGGETFGNYTMWHAGEPNNYRGNENCVKATSYGWFDSACEQNVSFICNWRFMLVKESKTWEEAHQYCRSHYRDLAVLDSVTLLDLLNTETEQTQTASVWTGLRFLHGTWLWVNGTLLRSLVSLPSCPVEPYRCGAYNFNMYAWENRDCKEELNFVCYY